MYLITCVIRGARWNIWRETEGEAQEVARFFRRTGLCSHVVVKYVPIAK